MPDGVERDILDERRSPSVNAAEHVFVCGLSVGAMAINTTTPTSKPILNAIVLRRFADELFEFGLAMGGCGLATRRPGSLVRAFCLANPSVVYFGLLRREMLGKKQRSRNKN